MLRRLIMGLLIVSSFSLRAQLDDGALAPDFTGLDLDGNTINLYDILAEGKAVVLDIGATWCQPCWLYHQSGELEEFNAAYGPTGTDQARVLFVEGDVKTGLEDLQGTGSATFGNWIEGTSYSIMSMGGIPALYEVFGLPFTYLICPDRTTKLVQQIPAEALAEQMDLCTSVDIVPVPEFSTVLSSGCGQLQVDFEDRTWPRGDSYLWEFGDGATSTLREPVHLYAEAGEYTVALTVSNAYGQKTLTKAMTVSVAEGHPASNRSVGKRDTMGSGRMFDRGVQGLVFDAHQDFILSSATVYSDKDDWRTFVVLDSADRLVARRDMRIPVGEHRIQLDMEIPSGQDYRIAMWSDAWLYRNDGGTAYPYSIDSLVTIKSSTVPSDPTGFYYYLYDWKVRETDCNAIPSSVIDAKDLNIVIRPNPANETLVIESLDPNLPRAQVYNLSGQLMRVNNNDHQGLLSVDVSKLSAGVYIIRLGSQQVKFVKI